LGFGAQYLTSLKPVLDTRCVVCHGCYDAPCQLKLTSPEGIDRGVSKERVYDGTRLLAQTPSRLLYDAKDTQTWRDKGFTPVLNERVQTEQANLMGSVLYNSLLLKI
ncbi:9-hexadecenoic acid cis-trans isomerase, partial [Pseudoalteromonas ruthenica]